MKGRRRSSGVSRGPGYRTPSWFRAESRSRASSLRALAKFSQKLNSHKEVPHAKQFSTVDTRARGYNYPAMAEHYVCTGNCGGESAVAGVCENEGCSKEGYPLVACSCEDGVHEGAKGSKSVKEEEDEAEI